MCVRYSCCLSQQLYRSGHFNPYNCSLYIWALDKICCGSCLTIRCAAALQEPVTAADSCVQTSILSPSQSRQTIRESLPAADKSLSQCETETRLHQAITAHNILTEIISIIYVWLAIRFYNMNAETQYMIRTDSDAVWSFSPHLNFAKF